jgi:hypothetical protein
MTVKEKNPKKGGLPEPEDCPSTHHIRVGQRGSHKGLSDEKAKKKELSDSAEAARRAASDQKLATLQQNAAPLTKIRGQIAAAAGNADRVAYLRGVLRKERLKLPSAENAVKEHEFERKVQENARWTSVQWHCTDCSLSGEIDAVMKNGTIKECKSNAKPNRVQFREKYLVGVPAIFGRAPIHIAAPVGTYEDVKQSMASTKDQQFAGTGVQEH